MLKYNLYLKNYWESQYDEHHFVDYGAHFSQEEPCNIYLIGIRSRICIDPDYIKLEGKKLSLCFNIQDKFNLIPIAATLSLNRDPVGEVRIQTEAPYSRFNLIDDEGYLFDQEQFQAEKGVQAKSLYALRHSLIESELNFNDLEILYIGQSVKMDTKVSAVKRIQVHEKMQRILEKCTEKYFDKEVYVILCSFVAKTDMVARGNELSQVADLPSYMERMRENAVMLKSSNSFITQVAEAALIDYLDTRDFNKDFIGSFGRNTHKYYKQIKAADVSSIILEVDLSKLCRIHTAAVPAKGKHTVAYFPKDRYRKEIGEDAIKSLIGIKK